MQLDIKTFRKIETVLEDYALIQSMNETAGDEKFNLEQVKEFYKSNFNPL